MTEILNRTEDRNRAEDAAIERIMKSSDIQNMSATNLYRLGEQVVLLMNSKRGTPDGLENAAVITQVGPTERPDLFKNK